MKLNKSKVLLEVEFPDSLDEAEFNVKIIDHIENIVFGECIEVDIRHPEENFITTYEKEEFPEKFFADLDFIGWSHVLGEIKDRL